MLGSPEKFAAIQQIQLIETLDTSALMFYPPTE